MNAIESHHGRLPAECYTPDLGAYPNPANPDLHCIQCGAKEGEEHHARLCPARGVHVSFQRHAFEYGYRAGARRMRGEIERIMKILAAPCRPNAKRRQS